MRRASSEARTHVAAAWHSATYRSASASHHERASRIHPKGVTRIRVSLPAGLLRFVLAENPSDDFFDGLPGHEDDEGEDEGDQRGDPLAAAACRAERRDEPDGGGGGEPVDALGRLEDRPAAEEADAGDDALDDAAEGVDVLISLRRHAHGDEDDERRPERHERMRAHAGGLAAHFAVDADARAERRSGDQPQN